MKVDQRGQWRSFAWSEYNDDRAWRGGWHDDRSTLHAIAVREWRRVLVTPSMPLKYRTCPLQLVLECDNLSTSCHTGMVGVKPILQMYASCKDDKKRAKTVYTCTKLTDLCGRVSTMICTIILLEFSHFGLNRKSKRVSTTIYDINVLLRRVV